MKDSLRVGDVQLSDREILVFNALKRINLGRLSNTFTDTHSDVSQMVTLSQNTHTWASKVQIYQAVNPGRVEYITMSNLDNNLQKLLEKDLIDRFKLKGQRDYFYVIRRSSIDAPINLPHPSDIYDPIHQNKTVQVRNPVTSGFKTI
jgi:hypothetical protein